MPGENWVGNKQDCQFKWLKSPINYQSLASHGYKTLTRVSKSQIQSQPSLLYYMTISLRVCMAWNASAITASENFNITESLEIHLTA